MKDNKVIGVDSFLVRLKRIPCNFVRKKANCGLSYDNERRLIPIYDRREKNGNLIASPPDMSSFAPEVVAAMTARFYYLLST